MNCPCSMVGFYHSLNFTFIKFNACLLSHHVSALLLLLWSYNNKLDFFGKERNFTQRRYLKCSCALRFKTETAMASCYISDSTVYFPGLPRREWRI